MNLTLHNLAMDTLNSIRDQLGVLLLSADVSAKDVGAATVTFKLSRTAAHTMLISASSSNPGYEELDFSNDVRTLLARVDRLLAVASAFAKTADD